MNIPAGYRLAVLSPQGTILETIDLADTDPRKPLAAVDLGYEITTVVEKAERESAEATA